MSQFVWNPADFWQLEDVHPLHFLCRKPERIVAGNSIIVYMHNACVIQAVRPCLFFSAFIRPMDRSREWLTFFFFGSWCVDGWVCMCVCIDICLLRIKDAQAYCFLPKNRNCKENSAKRRKWVQLTISFSLIALYTYDFIIIFMFASFSGLTLAMDSS